MDVAQLRAHLHALCDVVGDRRPGSRGNRQATAHVAEAFAAAGWQVDRPRFACLDWRGAIGHLDVAGTRLDVSPSPYGLGVDATGPIRLVDEPAGLERRDLTGSILVLHGSIATEPLTPKGFPFYGDERSELIIAALEAARPAVVLAVTGRFPSLCGALDPFPLIEDGDFPIPTANLRPDAAADLFDHEGAMARVAIDAERWEAHAENVIATRGPRSPRVTVIAHVDAKPGTPGAVDNAAGVVALIDLADRLSPHRGELPIGVELLAVNGEDHFAAPGEVDWLAANGSSLDDIELVVNVDGAGYRGGRSAWSAYHLDDAPATHVAEAFAPVESLAPGPAWYQSDHAIFAMAGRPAVAITTDRVDEMLETLFHAPTDTPDQVDLALVADVAEGIERLIRSWPPDA